jgi:two-component system sensor histidine kinase DctS
MENSLITGLRARDMHGRMTYVNPAFCKMVGYPAEQIIGRLPPMPYWAPEVVEEYQQRFSKLLAGSVPQDGFETIYQHASGERIPVLIYESPLIDESGKQTGWMSSILDISELKRAQELTRQQEAKLHSSARLATMGEIASMLAHELNQPLAAISSYTTGAMNLLEAGDTDKALLLSAMEKVKTQAQRAGQIIRSVHEFVKKREPTRELVDINVLIKMRCRWSNCKRRPRTSACNGCHCPAHHRCWRIRY